MKNVNVLDCTLRDGAYLVDKKFGVNIIKGIIDGLVKSGIDIIEIGFLQNEGSGEGKTVYKNAKEAQMYIPPEKESSEFAVLADYSRYSVENLDVCDGQSFTIVRACFFKKECQYITEFCREIKHKGYKVYVQPVDILGYSDMELIELINKVNAIEPDCFSIVDTFGSMYINDLRRVYSLIAHNLKPDIKIGLHSHNNLQMSNALAQEFINMAADKRKIVIDTTLCGMGRGAGNTPTELVVQYINTVLAQAYDMDMILDTIDQYLDTIRSKCEWGYSVPYFIAGCYGAHVNNVKYLMEKNSISSKAMRHILNAIGSEKCKRYDYDLLEKEYVGYIESDIDDTAVIQYLEAAFKDKIIVILAPGKSITDYQEDVKKYIRVTDAIVIAVNFIPDCIGTDYLYLSNIKRYNYWKKTEQFNTVEKICTSNIEDSDIKNVVSCERLIKSGWSHTDNSMLMVLRLLDYIDAKEVAVAGFDGFSSDKDSANYLSEDMELFQPRENANLLNEEIAQMLKEFTRTRKHDYPISFITPSKFEGYLK